MPFYINGCTGQALGTSERQVRKAIDVLRDKRIRSNGDDLGEWVIIG